MVVVAVLFTAPAGARVVHAIEHGRIGEARLAVGACSPVAVRLGALKNRLTGLVPSDVRVTVEDLAPLSPIDDVRGSATYRLEAAAAQIKRAIRRAAA